MNKVTAEPNSADTLCPCLALLGHLTADKREIKDFPKLSTATSFIRKPLYDIDVLAEDLLTN